MLKPGDVAPTFTLACATEGRASSLSLGTMKAELIVLFFYPRDFSFICPTEVVGFHKAAAEFAAENTALIGASVDDAETHIRWARSLGGICYPLLADAGGKVARAYGVFDEARGVAMRATFILDAERVVAYAMANRINVGRSVGETLRVVRALRCGRLCPADWTPDKEFGPPEEEY